MKLFSFLFFTTFLALTSTVNAFEVPALAGPVMDQAGLLQPSIQQSLSEDIYQFKAKTGAQIQVLIVKTLDGEPIENVTIKIFDQWKLGDAKKDTGILFLVAIADKKMRIEVGQGLEGAVPDVIAKRIIVEVVRPFFQRGQFDVGIQAGVASIQHYIVTGDESFLDNNNPNIPQKGKIPVHYLLFGLGGIFVILFLFSPALAMQLLFALLSGGRGGGGGGGGGRGGGWSGGGGSSSGGGASGDW